MKKRGELPSVPDLQSGGKPTSFVAEENNAVQTSFLTAEVSHPAV